MKILILTNEARGLYLFRKELLQNLMEEGHEIVISVPADKDCVKLTDLGCEVKETKLERRGSNPVKDIGLFAFYVKTILSVCPDVVFTYTIKPNIYGGLACTLCRVPYIENITGFGTAIEKNSFLSRILIALYGLSTKKAACVFFQNERNREFMRAKKVACKNSRMLPGSGVNLIEHEYNEYPSEAEEIRILSVMRIMKDKGIEEYIEAVQKIKTKYDNVSFTLVGEYEKETRQQYEPCIQELQNKGWIHYLGHIDYVKKVMAKSHFVLHPSYHEGLSNVLLEAAACGRPVLASNIYGCIETFQEGVSGFSFEARNADSLVKAIEKMLSLSEEKRKQMGIAGRQWIEEHFDRTIVINAYREELGKLLRKTRE